MNLVRRCAHERRPQGYALLIWLLCVVTYLVYPLASAGDDRGKAQTPVLYGFTAFPYDADAETERRVDEIILPNSTLYAAHRDDCLPWAEALEARAFPQWLEEDLRSIRARIPETHTVYVAITPTATDRRSLAPACGSREGEEAVMPAALRAAGLDHPEVQRAYLNYARRVIAILQPKFINIGIEISELALKSPASWPAFESLFRATYSALKAEEPGLQIGIEMVLQSLSMPAVASLVKPVVESADYLGISFYPYTSAYGEYFGATKLPSPPDEWRSLLDWLPTYTSKPIAICETGYSSQPVFIREGPGFQFGGSLDLQDAFLKDLIRFATRDQYLFVVWFIAVDYEKLLRQLPNVTEAMRIWMYTGLLTPSLEPKPAWTSWQLWRQQPDSSIAGAPARQAEATPGVAGAVTAGMTPSRIVCSGKSALDREAKGPDGAPSAIAWTVEFNGVWEFCDLPLTANKSAQGIKVTMRSDKADAVLIRIEQKSGDMFNYILPVGLDWMAAEIPFTQFVPDPLGQPGRCVTPGEIVKLGFGEGTGAEGARGSRTIFIASLDFY